MADEGSSDEELCDMMDILDGLDPIMINVLRQYGEIDDAEIEIEMADGFTKEEVSNTRQKLFEGAKQKAAKCLTEPNAGGIFGPNHTSQAFADILLSKAAVDQWQLVTRRKINNYAKDAIELLAFLQGTDAVFPAKVVKSLSLDKGTYENHPEAEAEALSQLDSEILEAGGSFSVEIVNNGGDSETHLITVEPERRPDTGEEQSGTPNNPGSSQQPYRDVAGTDPYYYNRETDDPLFILVKSFIAMSERMMESFVGNDQVMKTAYQFHREYMEKMAHDTAEKVKQIGEWQKGVNERLDRLEKRKELTVQRAPVVIVDHDSSGDSDTRNEPPVNAVSQRRDTDREANEAARGRNQKQTVAPVGPRKQFPPKSIHETPNPRLKDRQETNGARNKVPIQKKPSKKAEVKEKVTTNTRPDTRSTKASSYFEDDNPYSPLAQTSSAKENTVTQGRSATRGRGRMRKQVNIVSPGDIPRQTPAVKPNDSGHNDKPYTAPPETGSGSDHDMETHHVNDMSSSWYDEDDDLEDQSMITAAGSDDAAGEDDNHDHIDQPRDPEPILRRSNMPSNDRDKGRKRTSTKEAPIDSPPPQSNETGKSTAPMSKKPKTDRSGQVRKNTYAESLDNGVWLTPESKKYKRSKLGNRKIPELKCATEMALKEVYVQELDCTTCSCTEEFEDMVINYCRKRGLRAVDACRIPVKGNRLKSGCKLTVRDSDYGTAMSRDFWPKGTTTRRWNQKPRSDSDEDGEGNISE